MFVIDDYSVSEVMKWFVTVVVKQSVENKLQKIQLKQFFVNDNFSQM